MASAAATSHVPTAEKQLPSEDVASTTGDASDSSPSISSASDAFSTAMKFGCINEARREVEKAEAAGQDPRALFGDAALEQLERVGNKFEEVQRLFETKVSDLPINAKNPKMNMEWGIQIDTKAGMLRSVSMNEYNFDMVTGIAARFEKDLEKNIDPNVIELDAVSDSNPTDVIWRKLLNIKATRSQTDDIIQVSMMNNLASSDSVWTLVYTPPEAGCKELRGVAIPEPVKGAGRNDYILCATKFTPLRDPSTGEVRGFQELCASEIRLSSMLCTALSFLPNMVVRSVVKSWFEAGVPGFTTFAQTNKDLAERLTNSPRAELYKQLQSEIQGAALHQK